ncbi:hypothetical protein ACPWT1_20910 [Ramlibacter sp. MMS24-I3-19]|uniref:hypothetical protein n=1 Tax=Ramlibacter sp. MMS24-I3-19 TaxID=3416606 RepID=UPI003D0543CA
MHISSTRATRGRVASHLLLSALALALAACGGGGGSGTDMAATATSTGSTTSTTTALGAGSGAVPTGSTVSAQVAQRPAVIRVNADAAGQQTLADIATLQGGGYAIAYLSRPGSGAASVHVQRFTADGQRSGADVAVALPDGESDATVAVLPDGSVVIATLQTGNAASTPSITRTTLLLRHHDASGAAMGAPMQVASLDQDRTAGGAMHYIAAPKLVHWEDGSFMLAWSQVTDDANGKVPEFWGRRFDTEALPIGVNLPIGSGTAGSSLRIVAAPGGGFVIATTLRANGANWLMYRGFDGSKSPVLPPDALGAAEGSVLLPLYGGSQVLLSPVKNVVAVQRYDAQGQLQGEGLGLPAMPAGMAALRDGTFVLVVDDGTGTLRAQHYDAQVQPVGGAQAIAGSAGAVQGQALGDGGLVLAWTANTAGDQDVMATRTAP